MLGFAALMLLAEVLWRIGLRCLDRTDGRGIEDLYVAGMNELLAKDAAFFRQLRRFVDQARAELRRAVRGVRRHARFSVVARIVPLAFASVILWSYEPLLVVVLVGLIVVTGLGIAPLIRRRQTLDDQREAAIARVSGHVADSLTNMETVRAFAAEDREAAEHRTRVAEQRVLAIRDVRFTQVSFAHAGAPSLFTGLDLTVPSGTKVGLVGRSGGGKSTLIRLLLRLMDVDEGRVLIGGQDISRLRQADLRSLIAYVPQDPAMFHRTLRDNIAFARPGASDAEIHRAAQAAHVTEFAAALPDGFDTLVGEHGIKLSGGQRQRVALARAILRDAPILLLDEATSALDSESEILIQHALWQLMDGRTALVVAHRLSTVVRMDQLVVLDRGRIVEQGTHDELRQMQGTYARLWHHQSGGFLADNSGTSPSDQATTPGRTAQVVTTRPTA